MKTCLYFFLFISLLSCKKDDRGEPTQPPVEHLPEFNKLYGGSANDLCNAIIATVDGGYLAAGETESRDGDLNGNHGDSDAWIVKLDKNGNKLWQKLIGGSGYDQAACIVGCKDGHYVMAGGTLSFDGDVSTNQGLYGAWVVKLDETGQILWQKILGESTFDFANAMIQTPDEGFLVAGFTSVLDEDVDAWVVKLDKTGSITWQKNFGGLADDRIYSIAQDLQGGFILAGGTESSDGALAGNHGKSDFWIVKLDNAGRVDWQKTYGGTGEDIGNYVLAAKDGGYVIAGLTGSNDGDITMNHGSSDLWVIQVDNTGNLQWQRSMGGSAFDNAHAITETLDHKFLVASYANSNDGDITGNHGKSDFWMVELDKQGEILWRKTYGGSGIDVPKVILTRSDSSFVAAGSTRSNDGDVSGNHGESDAWIFTIHLK